MSDKELDITHMIQAVELAKACRPSSERIPKVGAVIAIGDVVVGSGQRDEGNEKDEHAEYNALQAVHDPSQLYKATIYTTLEPCTSDVRSRGPKACTELILNSGIKRAFIGILDPNQGVTGKGLWRLQTANVEVELFPPDLASQIRSINDAFIYVQQSYGIHIDFPKNGEKFSLSKTKKTLSINGTSENPLGPDVYAICRFGNQWWPQPSNFSLQGGRWETTVWVTAHGIYDLYIVKANHLGSALIDYYQKIIAENRRRVEVVTEVMSAHGLQPSEIIDRFPGIYPGIKISGLPKGLEILDQVSVEMVQ